MKIRKQLFLARKEQKKAKIAKQQQQQFEFFFPFAKENKTDSQKETKILFAIFRP